MMHIKMIASETVQTSRGPQTYRRGQDYLVEDWIANSLLGRGFAIPFEQEVIENGHPDYASMTVKDLKVIAEERGVPGFAKLKKDELVSALLPLSPPPEPFKRLN